MFKIRLFVFILVSVSLFAFQTQAQWATSISGTINLSAPSYNNRNVGIGTQFTPARAKLDVVGTTILQGNTTIAGQLNTNQVRFADGTVLTTAGLTVINTVNNVTTTTSPVYWTLSGSNLLNNTQNIGLGVSPSGVKLDVNGNIRARTNLFANNMVTTTGVLTNNATVTGTTYANQIQFKDGSVLNSANLNSSKSTFTSLTTSGFVLANQPAIGKVLTSDAQGNATWQTLPTATPSQWISNADGSGISYDKNINVTGTIATPKLVFADGTVQTTAGQTMIKTIETIQSTSVTYNTYVGNTNFPDLVKFGTKSLYIKGFNQNSPSTDQSNEIYVDNGPLLINSNNSQPVQENTILNLYGGYVGIGTNKPHAESKLHVKGISPSGWWGGLIIASGDNASVLSGQLFNKAIIGGAKGDQSAWDNLYVNPNYNVNGAENVNPGNVGIGVNTSSTITEKLEVNGNVKATSFKYSDGTPLTSSQWTTKADKTGIIYDKDVNIGTNTLNAFYDNNQVGIGTADPNQEAKLHVKGKTTKGSWQGLIISQGDNASVLIGELNKKAAFGAANGMLTQWDNLYINPVDNSAYVANVGIGVLLNNTITEKLEVNGNVKATSFIDASGTLTSSQWTTKTDQSSLITGISYGKDVSITQKLDVQGNTSLNGQLGIGTSTPHSESKLHIRGYSPSSFWSGLIIASGDNASILTGEFEGKAVLSGGNALKQDGTDDWNDLYINPKPRGFGNLAPTNVGIGVPTDNTIDERLVVNGNVKATDFKYANGTSLTSSQWASNGADISFTTGKVGIGVVPTNELYTYGLKVKGNIDIKSEDDLNSSIWGSTTKGVLGYNINSNAIGNKWAWRFVSGDLTTGNEYFKVDYPTGDVTVKGSLIMGQLPTGVSNSQVNLYVKGKSTNEGGWNGLAVVSGDNYAVAYGEKNGKAVISGHPASLNNYADLYLQPKETGNIQGKIGIGLDPDTQTPSELVDINGTLKATTIKAGSYLDLNGKAISSSQWTSNANSTDIGYTNGNVGIGTNTPSEKLEVSGTIQADNFKFPNGKTLNAHDWHNYSVNQYGCAFYKAHVLEQGDNTTFLGFVYDRNDFSNSDISRQTIPNYYYGVKPENYPVEDTYIKKENYAEKIVCTVTSITASVDKMETDSKVQINNLLSVKDRIDTKEVRVCMTPGTCPDYVFEKSYKLWSLGEVENYIQTNKHLPEVPSAKDMENDGMNMKQMNLILLKKVEELTLHLIEMKKEIDGMKTKK